MELSKYCNGKSGVSNDGTHLHELVSSSTFFRPLSLKSSPAMEHLPFVFWTVEVLRPALIVELGTRNGEMLCEVAASLGIKTSCVAVEQHPRNGNGATGGHSPRGGPHFSQLFRHAFDEAIAEFEDRGIDLLLVGDLKENGNTPVDLAKWLPKLSPRSLLLFYNINEQKGGASGSVRPPDHFAGYRFFDFPQGDGLRVVGTGVELPEQAQRLLAAADNAVLAAKISDVYSRIGTNLRREHELAAALNKSNDRITHIEGVVAEQSARQLRMDRQIAELQDRNDLVERALDSAEQWQKSWFRRAFRRWHPPVEEARPATGFLARLERSIHKRSRTFQALYGRIRPETKGHANSAATPVRLICDSGHFNEFWYSKHYGKKFVSMEAAVMHYLQEGAMQGLNPGPAFNTTAYLHRYPDVAAAGVNPLLHYIQYGKSEGREPNPKKGCDISADYGIPPQLRLNPARKTILLVTHEMSRTGAPILVLNLAKYFRQKYNLVILSLLDTVDSPNGGALTPEFADACDLLLGPFPIRQRNTLFLTPLFQQLAARVPITFAIVNSIVSNVALKPLWDNDIASIHLIHEFSCYVRPRGQFLESAFYSSAQVFPASVVHESAITDCRDIGKKTALILPQGLCNAPTPPDNPSRSQAEQQYIRNAFRPPGWPEETVVIAGMGLVQLRKGVDLFIACAKRVLEKNPATPFRFVWIGCNYNPETDLNYSIYLEDEIQRAGMENIVTIIGEIAELETAYQELDILFLSSRLDPLPLVSQDAMGRGKPVVCFEKATGIAEYLAEDPATAPGVVPYMDIEAAADRICNLINDPSLRKKIGDAGSALVKSRFSFSAYAHEIEALASKQAARKSSENRDRKIIAQSGLFRPGFFCAPGGLDSQDRALRRYTTGWATGLFRRKPFPGFHPGIYAEHHHVENRDPLAHYIESGQPKGPWLCEVIEPKDSTVSEVATPGTALHLHLHYPDMAADIATRLSNLKTKMDLLVSVTSGDAAIEVEATLQGCYVGNIDIRVVPNRGRDIGPFLTEFRDAILGRYELVGHIHTKKSKDFNTPLAARNWSDFLFENLLGGEAPMGDLVLGRMAADPTIGLVFPDDPHAVGWDENRECAALLAKRMGIASPLPGQWLNFPVGTMFWARTAALKPLWNLAFTWQDYPVEPLPYDGTTLHAIERLLPLVAESAGYRNAVTHVPGITR